MHFGTCQFDYSAKYAYFAPKIPTKALSINPPITFKYPCYEYSPQAPFVAPMMRDRDQRIGFELYLHIRFFKSVIEKIARKWGVSQWLERSPCSR